MISPEQLRRFPFFGGLTAGELSGIAMIAEEVRFPDGAIIFRDGEVATKLYVLVSGAIDLVYHIERNDGVEISFVGSLAAGEPFGVSAFVEPYRLMATGRPMALFRPLPSTPLSCVPCATQTVIWAIL
jgi:CRP-like cAMP-binding protein